MPKYRYDTRQAAEDAAKFANEGMRWAEFAIDNKPRFDKWTQWHGNERHRVRMWHRDYAMTPWVTVTVRVRGEKDSVWLRGEVTQVYNEIQKLYEISGHSSLHLETSQLLYEAMKQVETYITEQYVRLGRGASK
jgi:hypothetical protein